MAFLQVVKYLLYGIVKGRFYAAKCTQTCGDASQKRKEEKIRGKLRGGDPSHVRYLICGGRNKQEYSLCGKHGKIFGLE